MLINYWDNIKSGWVSGLILIINTTMKRQLQKITSILILRIKNNKIKNLICVSVLMLCIITSCTKVNYNKVYAVGTKFNYAAGPLSDLVQSGKTPTNPFVIDSISPGTYGDSMGYHVVSSNGIYYTMSDSDIKEVNWSDFHETLNAINIKNVWYSECFNTVFESKNAIFWVKIA